MTDLSEVIDAHRPADDWKCRCGEDLFGGSAAYSWQLYLAHVSDMLRPLIDAEKRAAWDDGYGTCLGDFDIAARREARSVNPYEVTA